MILKSCPFCGSPAQMCSRDPGMDIAPRYYFASCTKCPVKTAAVYTAEWTQKRGYIDNPNAERQAAEFWNTRQ